MPRFQRGVFVERPEFKGPKGAPSSQRKLRAGAAGARSKAAPAGPSKKSSKTGNAPFSPRFRLFFFDSLLRWPFHHFLIWFLLRLTDRLADTLVLTVLGKIVFRLIFVFKKSVCNKPPSLSDQFFLVWVTQSVWVLRTVTGRGVVSKDVSNSKVWKNSIEKGWGGGEQRPNST